MKNEFDKFYVFNTRGNSPKSDDLRQKEESYLFGSGSRTLFAIILVVIKRKNDE